MLQVVEKEEHLPLANVLGQAVLRTQGLRDRLHDEGGFAERGQPDPEDARLVRGSERRRGLNS